MDLFATKEVVNSAPSFLEHERKFDQLLRDSKPSRFLRSIKSEEYERDFLDQSCESLVSGFKGAHHVLFDGQDMVVNIDTINERKTNTSGARKITGRASRRINLFESEYTVYFDAVDSGSVDSGGDMLSCNADVGRAKSVLKELQRHLRGGDTSLLSDTRNYLLMAKMSKGQNYEHMCCKLYLILMQVVLAYAVDEAQMRVSDVIAQVLPQTELNLMLAGENCDVILDYDIFSEEERALLTAALSPAPACQVYVGDEVSWYSGIAMKGERFVYLSGTVDQVKEVDFSQLVVMPPAVLHGVILGIIGKLRCYDDWITAVHRMRGVPAMLHLLRRREDFLDGEALQDVGSSNYFCSDLTVSYGIGTILEYELGSAEMVEYNNLPSSSVNILLDYAWGQEMLNRIHYLVEEFGFCSNELYCGDDPSGTIMYKSLARELGFYTPGIECMVYQWVTTGRMCELVSCLTNGAWRTLVSAWSRLGRGCIAHDKHSKDVLVDMFWPPISLFFDAVGSINTSVLGGAPLRVDKHNMGVRVRGLESLYGIMGWLQIHGVWNTRPYFCGPLSVMNLRDQAIPSDVYTMLSTAEGVYQNAGSWLSYGNVRCSRLGYDTAVRDGLFRKATYLALGESSGESQYDVEPPEEREPEEVVRLLDAYREAYTTADRGSRSDLRLEPEAEERATLEQRTQPKSSGKVVKPVSRVSVGKDQYGVLKARSGASLDVPPPMRSPEAKAVEHEIELCGDLLGALGNVQLDENGLLRGDDATIVRTAFGHLMGLDPEEARTVLESRIAAEGSGVIVERLTVAMRNAYDNYTDLMRMRDVGDQRRFAWLTDDPADIPEVIRTMAMQHFAIETDPVEMCDGVGLDNLRYTREEVQGDGYCGLRCIARHLDRMRHTQGFEAHIVAQHNPNDTWLTTADVLAVGTVLGVRTAIYNAPLTLGEMNDVESEIPPLFIWKSAGHYDIINVEVDDADRADGVIHADWYIPGQDYLGDVDQELVNRVRNYFDVCRVI
jgi:hypothetical protein